MQPKEKAILLVEDNPDDVALTVRAFRKNDIENQIVVAKDGVEALDYLFGTGIYAGRDTQEQPHLVLLDLSLPRLGGLDVLRHIRGDARTKLQLVVVLTTSTEEKDIALSYELGANSYVRKPVDFDNFLEAARQIGLYWLVVNLPPPTHAG